MYQSVDKIHWHIFRFNSFNKPLYTLYISLTFYRFSGRIKKLWYYVVLIQEKTRNEFTNIKRATILSVRIKLIFCQKQLPKQRLFKGNMINIFIHIHSYIYSTTKHKILQISNHNLLCSLDPPNQGWLFWVVGPKLINDTE